MQIKWESMPFYGIYEVGLRNAARDHSFTPSVGENAIVASTFAAGNFLGKLWDCIFNNAVQESVGQLWGTGISENQIDDMNIDKNTFDAMLTKKEEGINIAIEKEENTRFNFITINPEIREVWGKKYGLKSNKEFNNHFKSVFLNKEKISGKNTLLLKINLNCKIKEYHY